MNLIWTPHAWEEYTSWQDVDRKIVKRINDLIKECLRTPFEGKGKPEPLKGDLSGFWSRRITDEHRLVYKVSSTEIAIVQCRNHY
ncbi:toxin YoeB [Emticicia aquatilis]|uniref:Putative mRNA interferase YoeB n=1 Tax=Emticicia aquatilis TaxID=1537369 RepID=A0A917DRK5_9BACT|nr:Txe/YoeB family addiction module toxin [Emticicia aquatilis]GGD62018.1 toxin YoeB [Emticicia aquatilis]